MIRELAGGEGQVLFQRKYTHVRVHNHKHIIMSTCLSGYYKPMTFIKNPVYPSKATKPHIPKVISRKLKSFNEPSGGQTDNL